MQTHQIEPSADAAHLLKLARNEGKGLENGVRRAGDGDDALRTGAIRYGDLRAALKNNKVIIKKMLKPNTKRLLLLLGESLVLLWLGRWQRFSYLFAKSLDIVALFADNTADFLQRRGKKGEKVYLVF